MVQTEISGFFSKAGKGNSLKGFMTITLPKKPKPTNQPANKPKKKTKKQKTQTKKQANEQTKINKKNHQKNP